MKLTKSTVVTEDLLHTIFFVIKQENGSYTLLLDPSDNNTPAIIEADKLADEYGKDSVAPLIIYELRTILKDQGPAYEEYIVAKEYTTGKPSPDFYFAGLQFKDMKLKQKMVEQIRNNEFSYINSCINYFKKLNLLNIDSPGCFNGWKVISNIEVQKLIDDLSPETFFALNRRIVDQYNEGKRLYLPSGHYEYATIINKELDKVIGNPIVLKQ